MENLYYITLDITLSAGVMAHIDDFDLRYDAYFVNDFDVYGDLNDLMSFIDVIQLTHKEDLYKKVKKVVVNPERNTADIISTNNC